MISNINLRVLSTVATLSELAAINTTILKNGAIVFVTGVRDYYFILKESTDVADGTTIVQSVTGSPGRWFRMNLAAAVSWGAQSDWYVDPVNGDDGRTGDTLASSIQTMSELSRRLAGARIEQPTTVHVLNDVPDTDPFYAPAAFAPGARMIVQGENPTVLRSGVLTGATAQVPASNTRNAVVDAAIDWTTAGPGGTSLIGERLRATAGSGSGAICWLEAIGGSADTAFTNRQINPTTFAQSNFSGTTGYVVEQLTKMGPWSVRSEFVTQPPFQPPVLFRDLAWDLTTSSNQLKASTQVIFQGCKVGIFSQAFTGPSTYLACSVAGDAIVCGSEGIFFFGSSVAVPSLFGSGVVTSQFLCSFTNSVGINGPKFTFQDATGFWDWLATDEAIRVFPKGILDAQALLFGTNAAANSYGLNVRSGGFGNYPAASVPNIIGALSPGQDVVVGGSAAAYAGLPIGYNVAPGNAALVVRAT